MEKFDHSQNTIDVQDLLSKAPTDLSAEKDLTTPSELIQQTCPPANIESKPDATSSVSNPNNQMTQTIPQGHITSPVGIPSAPLRSYPKNGDKIEPEDLEEEDLSPDDQSDYDKRRKIIIISICAGVLTVLLVLIGLIIFIASGDGTDVPDNNEKQELIYENVFAGGIDLSGKNIDQAKNLLHLKTDHTFSQESMVVKLPGSSITLSPEETEAKLDVDAVVEAAYNCGRDGVAPEGGTYNIALLPYLTLDYEYIENTINAFCENNSSELTDPEVTLEGSRPQFDPENPNQEIRHQTLCITLGTPEYVLNAEDLYEQVLNAYSMNQMTLEYAAPEMVEPESVDVAALYEQYCTPSQNAVLDPATYEITTEVYGYGFDVNQAQKLVDDAYYGETVEITFGYLIPEILSSDLSQDMFVDTLAEYQIASNIDDSKRDNNLALSCDALNGYVVNAGATFSFNEALGRISTKNGYATAPVSSLNANIMGGGISQTASALYVCALVANLDIIERHSHEYAIEFCDLGLDAFADGSTSDFRFRNNTSSPIRIAAEAIDGKVRIQIFGTNTLDYDVEIVSKTIGEIPPLTSYQNMEVGNTAGYVDGDILQDGIVGYKVELYMEKYDLQTGSLLSSQQIATSEYAKRDEVIVHIAPVIIDPTTPTDDVTVPTDPTDPTDTGNNTEATETTEPSTEPTDATDPSGNTEPTVSTEPSTEATDATEEPTSPDPTETTGTEEPTAATDAPAA